MKMKIAIAVIVLLPVLAHAGYAVAMSPTADYYITVNQYVARSASTPIRVGGQVVPGTIQWNNATQMLSFQVRGDNATIDVAYRGPVPDSFRDNVTAILEGARTANGGFAATSLIVKCPHQYLPAG